MTRPRAQRRATSAVPRYLTDWFSGGPQPSVFMLHGVPWCALLRPRWQTWAKDHPGAAPPPGHERLADQAKPCELAREADARRMLRAYRRRAKPDDPLLGW